MSDVIESLCAQGQAALLETEYLAAEQALVSAEEMAWAAADYDALSRLYMPLQEARRQRRQFCGDGAFQTIAAKSQGETLNAEAIADQFPRGQLIVAGFGTIAPAVNLRAVAQARQLYLETPLAAAYDVSGQTVLLVVPTADVTLPSPEKVGSLDSLLRQSPAHSVIIPLDAIPSNRAKGDSGTFGYLMGVWETLHAPFLALADNAVDPKQKLIGYRQTLRIDYACEFAHQRFSQTARELSRHK